jgi:hypothetical protein
VCRPVAERAARDQQPRAEGVVMGAGVHLAHSTKPLWQAAPGLCRAAVSDTAHPLALIAEEVGLTLLKSS